MLKIILIIIGFLLGSINASSPVFAEELTPEENEDQSPVNESGYGLVTIEPTGIVRYDKETNQTYVLPYSERRKKWGSTFSLGGGLTYKPEDYGSSFVVNSFEEAYSDSEKPMIEFNMNFKRNFSFFSLGFEMGASSYSNESTTLLNSTLNLTFVRAGAELALDNLWSREPYVVPYVAGGVYTVFFKEEQNGSNSFNGNTQVSFYGTGGLMFELDWLDSDSSEKAYFSSGIQNTFIYAEATMYVQSSLESDPDFSSLGISSGLTLEF